MTYCGINKSMLFVVFTTLFLCLLSTTFAQTVTDNNCKQYLASPTFDRVFPVTIRGNTGVLYSDSFNDDIWFEGQLIDLLTKALKERHGLPVRFHFNPSKARSCWATRQSDSFGMELIMCRGGNDWKDSEWESYTDKETGDARFCRSQSAYLVEKSHVDLFRYNTLDNSKINSVAALIAKRLIKRYALNWGDHCTAWGNNGEWSLDQQASRTGKCFPAVSTAFCNDGYLQPGEGCDVNPFFSSSYFSPSTSSLFDKTCSSCQVVAGSSNFIAQDGALQYNVPVNNWRAPGSITCSGACGTYDVFSTGYNCIADGKSILSEYCTTWIQLTTPEDPEPTTCIGTASAPCQGREPKWLCKSYGAGGEMQWAECNDNQFGGLFDSNGIEITAIPKCGAGYMTKRIVGCGIVDSLYNFPDSKCAGIAPASSKLTPLSSCTTLHQYDFTPQEIRDGAVDKPIPSSAEWVQTTELRDGLPLPMTLPPEAKMGDCEMKYRRKFACLVQNSQTGEFVMNPDPIVCNPRLTPEYIATIDWVNENRCTPEWGCGVTTTTTTTTDNFVVSDATWYSCTDPRYDCNCGLAVVFRPVQCWGFHPILQQRQLFTGIYANSCSTSNKPDLYIPCLATNTAKRCYETVCLDMLEDRYVDCNTISMDLKYCTPDDNLCGIGELNDNTVQQVCAIRNDRIKDIHGNTLVDFISPPTTTIIDQSNVQLCNTTQYSTCDAECLQRWECTIRLDYGAIRDTLGYTAENFTQWGVPNDLNFELQHNTRYCASNDIVTDLVGGLRKEYCGTLPFIREVGCFEDLKNGTSIPVNSTMCNPINRPAETFVYRFNDGDACQYHCMDFRTNRTIGRCDNTRSFEQLQLNSTAICSNNNNNNNINDFEDSCRFDTYYQLAGRCLWYSSHTEQYYPIIANDGAAFGADDIELCSRYDAFTDSKQQQQQQTVVEGSIFPLPILTNNIDLNYQFYNLPCFKITPSHVLTRLTYASFTNRFESSTQAFAAAGSNCYFQMQCDFTYQDTTAALNPFTDPLNAVVALRNVSSTTPSKQNCDMNFNCNQGKICGTVQRNSECYMMTKTSSTTTPQTFNILPLSTYATQFTNLFQHDVMGMGILQNVEWKNECRAPDYATCSARDGCFERYCAIPTTIPNDDDDAAIRPDPLDFDVIENQLYTPEHCVAEYQQNYCQNIVTRPQVQCGRHQLPIFEACFDRFNQTFTSDETQCASQYRGEILQCPFYNDCVFKEQLCGFNVAETGAALPSLESSELCDSVFGDVTTAVDDTPFDCSNVPLCGKSDVYSRCVVQTPIENESHNTTKTYELSHQDCMQFFAAGSENYNDEKGNTQLAPYKSQVRGGASGQTTLQCENYQLCENVVCSRPTAGMASTPAETSFDLATRIEGNKYTSAELDYLFRVTLTSQNCLQQLDERLCGDLCGYNGRISRTVGCVAKLTAPTFAKTTRYIYDPNPTTCGVVNKDNNNDDDDDENNNEKGKQIQAQQAFPYTSIPCQGWGRGCAFSFQCSLNGAPYSPSSCSLLTCPAHIIPQSDIEQPPNSTTTLTTYQMTYATRCVATYNNTVVSTSACQSYRNSYLDSYKDAETCTATPTTSFCTDNLELPLDFTLVPKIWNGKTRQIYNPTKAVHLYQQRYNANCGSAIAANSISIAVVLKYAATGIEYTSSVNRVGFNVAYGTQLSLGYSMSAPVGTTGFIYLVPTDPNLSKDDATTYSMYNQQLPYLLSIVSNKAYDNTIRVNITSTIVPVGTYRVVLFINRGAIVINQYSLVIVEKLKYDTSGNTNINNIIHSATNQTQRIEYLLSSPIQTALNTNINNDDDVNTINVMNQLNNEDDTTLCSKQLCYNGYCVIDTIENKKQARCECFTGFSGDHCTLSQLCNVTNIKNENLICNTTNGILIPSLDARTYTDNTSNFGMQDCNTCHCLGHWDPTDGCNTCNLQCGLAGKPNADCTACICTEPYHGPQCEATKIQFSIVYALPPPILRNMYTFNKSPQNPKTNYDLVQLNAWKRIVSAETAVDLGVAVDDLEVVKFGTTKSKPNRFLVMFNLIFRMPLDTAEGLALQALQDNNIDIETLTSAEIRQFVAERHQMELNQQILTFSTSFDILGAIVDDIAPRWNMTNMIEYPTFNATTLIQRTPGASQLSIVDGDGEDEQQMIKYNNEILNLEDGDDDNNNNNNNIDITNYEILNEQQRLEVELQQFQELYIQQYRHEKYNRLINMGIEEEQGEENSEYLDEDNNTLMIHPMAFDMNNNNNNNGDEEEVIIKRLFFNVLSSSVTNTTVVQYKYRTTNAMAGVAADGSGGFVGYGTVYNTTRCAFPNVNKKTGKITYSCPSTPSLQNTIPKPPGESDIPWGLIWGMIVLGIILLIIFFCILLCCAWVKRCLFFKDYDEKKIAKLQREADQLSLLSERNPFQEHRLKVVLHEIKQLKRAQKKREKEMLNQTVMMTVVGSATGATTGPAQSKISNDRSNGSGIIPTNASATSGPSQYPPKSMSGGSSGPNSPRSGNSSHHRSRSKDKSNVAMSPSHSSQKNPALTMIIPPLSLSEPATSPTGSNNNTNPNVTTSPTSAAATTTTTTTSLQQPPPPVRTNVNPPPTHKAPPPVRKQIKPAKAPGAAGVTAGPGQPRVYGARAQLRQKAEEKERRRQERLATRRGNTQNNGAVTAPNQANIPRRAGVSASGSQSSSVTTTTTGNNDIAKTTSTKNETRGSTVAQRGGVTPATRSTATPRRMSIRNTNTKPTLTQRASVAPTVSAVAENDDDDDDDDDEDDEGDTFDAELPTSPSMMAKKPTGGAVRNKRRSLFIGGMKRMSVVGLPPGWTQMTLDGKTFYVNENTMQSTTLRPLPNGKIPDLSGIQKGMFD